MTLSKPANILITLGFLVLALALYTVGLVLPATLLFIAGAMAELVFWLRVLRRRR